MSRTVKSQWDFGGELFPPEQIRKVHSVTELTFQVRRLLEKDFCDVWVTGEISNLSIQRSGHAYFTLKDAGAQLACVLFRGETQVDRSLLQDGRKIIAKGDLTVYDARGQYQLRVVNIELQGLGALQAAFEKLKQKLKAEGLFSNDRKRTLPRFPERIGLVTSPTGAAIRDVLHVIERRNPSLQLILAPCRVQGDGASLEIAAALRLLNDYHSQLVNKGHGAKGLDLILVTRGGGSLEDLWAFNEEIVARAIFHSAVPVVSAVGHEIDFTISDFVADLRAATPSAAAELITEGVFSSCQVVSASAARMRQLARQRLARLSSDLRQDYARLQRVHPRRKFNEWLQRLDDLSDSLARCARASVRQQSVAFRNLAERLSRVRPRVLLNQRRELLEQEHSRLHEQVRHRVREARVRFESAQSRLRLLGPEQVLARGYSITADAKTGAIVRAEDQTKAGQLLRTRLAKGEVKSVVTKHN